MYKLVIFASLLAAVYCRPSEGYRQPSYDTPPKYNFDYAVKDDYAGLNFGHNEAREDYNTYGAYYVQLPDGRLQKVEYTVNGDEGYVAHVTYEGEAHYPEYKPSASYQPEPAYKPAPSYA